MIYGSGTVFGGAGTVWENPTRGLPVLNASEERGFEEAAKYTGVRDGIEMYYIQR